MLANALKVFYALNYVHAMGSHLAMTFSRIIPRCSLCLRYYGSLHHVRPEDSKGMVDRVVLS